MPARNEAFSNRGGIEVTMGARNRAVVAAHKKGQDEFGIENIEEYREAMRARLLYIGEPAIRTDKFGDIFHGTVIPSFRRTNRGKPVISWNRRNSIFRVRDDVIGIIEDYSEGGVQYEHRISAVKAVNRVGMRLQDGPLDDDRHELRDASIKAMADAGYTSSVYPGRVRTSEQLVRATELDSLGRPNPPRGRQIVESRRPQLIKDGLIADDVVKKNRRILSVIEAACDHIELDFEGIADFSENLAENKVGTGSFDTELARYLTIIDLTISPGKRALPKPYSELGAKVRYLLHPKHTKEDVSSLAKYMTPLDALDLIEKFPKGFKELLESAHEKGRIREIAKLIREELAMIQEQRSRSHKEAEVPAGEARNDLTPRERKFRRDQERQWVWIKSGSVENLFESNESGVDEK